MAAAAVKESTKKERTISFTEDYIENDNEISEQEPQRFHRGGKYLTLPSKAQRPERLLRDIPLPNITPTADRDSKLDTIMRYIRAFSNTIEYELYDRERWRELIQAQFRTIIEGLRTLTHFEDPHFR